jgi:hypothetical protein
LFLSRRIAQQRAEVTHAGDVGTPGRPPKVLPATQKRSHLAMAFAAQRDEIAFTLASEILVAAVMGFQRQAGRSCRGAQPAFAASNFELALSRCVCPPLMARDVASVVHIGIILSMNVTLGDSYQDGKPKVALSDSRSFYG